MARYMYAPPQQNYEINMHSMFYQQEKKLLRLLERDVFHKIKERKDYKAYYYVPVTAKYLRVSKDSMEEIERFWGDNDT